MCCLAFFLFIHLCLIGVRFGDDPRANTTKTHFKNILDHIFKICKLLHTTSYLIMRGNWEDLCIHIRNRQPCMYENHNQIMGGHGICLCFNSEPLTIPYVYIYLAYQRKGGHRTLATSMHEKTIHKLVWTTSHSIRKGNWEALFI